MGKITLRQAAQWCGGYVEEKYADVTFLGASNDTRELQPGQLFVALQGIQFPVHALRQTCIPPESIALHVVHVHSSVCFVITARDSAGFPVLSLQI